MLLDIPLYTQTTDFTCGAYATLMVWKYFDRNVQLSKRNELLIWMEIVALPFKFSSTLSNCNILYQERIRNEADNETRDEWRRQNAT
ncbi:MAG: peptidase C39 family protein [Candidatus Methanomethylicaceae archaeon]